LIADVVTVAIAGIGFCHAAGSLILYKGFRGIGETVLSKPTPCVCGEPTHMHHGYGVDCNVLFIKAR